MPNYNYVIDSSFKPFTFQEMLAPFAIYKEAAKKAREHYIDLSNKAGKFKVLAEFLPETSKAKQIYQGYADELSAQAADFGRNGLTMMNQNALTGLRSRYQEEIGTLETAQAKLDELTKARDTLAAAGKPMLYGNATPTIDDFLPGSKFNNYAVSTDDLYAKGARMGKAISERRFETLDGGKVLGDYYLRLINTQGIHPDSIKQFMESKELDDAIDAKLLSEGVVGNLEGKDYETAKAAIKQGIYEGIVYAETYKEERNPGKPSWKEVADYNIDNNRYNLEYNKYLLEKKKYENEEDRLKLIDAMALDPSKVDPTMYFSTATRKWQKIPKGYHRVDGSVTEIELDSSDSSGGAGGGTGVKGGSENFVAALEKALQDDVTPKMLKNEKGFDLQVKHSKGVDTVHYDPAFFIATTSTGNTHHIGKLGDDFEPRPFGFTSSDVIDWWGDYSTSNIFDHSSENNPTRILTENECKRIFGEGNNLTELGLLVNEQMKEYRKEHNIKPEANIPYEIVRVPNEGSSRESYMVIVRTM